MSNYSFDKTMIKQYGIERLNKEAAELVKEKAEDEE